MPSEGDLLQKSSFKTFLYLAGLMCFALICFNSNASELNQDDSRVVPVVGHSKAIDSFAYSEVTGIVVSSSWQGPTPHVMKVWESASGKLLRTIKDDGLGPVIISPDGKHALSGDALIELSTGSVVRRFGGEPPYNGSCGSQSLFSQDGEYVLLPGENFPSFWSVHSGLKVRGLGVGGSGRQETNSGPRSSIDRSAFDALALSPDGKVVVSGGSTGSYDGVRGALILWSATTGAMIKSLPVRKIQRSKEGRTPSIEAVSFSRDGRLLVSVDALSNAVVWDTELSTEVTSFNVEERAVSVEFSVDSQELLIAHGKSVSEWNWRSRIKKRTIQVAGDAHCVFLSKKGRYAFGGGSEFDSDFAGQSHKFAKINLQKGVVEQEFGKTIPFHSLAISPVDGAKLAVSTGANTLQIWSLSSGRVEATVRLPFQRGLSIDWSKDGQFLLVGGTEGKVAVIDTSRWQVANTISVGSREDVTWSLSTSAESDRFATASSDNVVRLFDLRSGRRIQSFGSPNDRSIMTADGYVDQVLSVRFGSGNQTVATGNADGSIKIWSLRGSGKRELDHHSNGTVNFRAVTALAISSNGDMISGSYDGMLKLWRNVSGSKVQTLQSPDDDSNSRKLGQIWTTGFSSDRKLIFSGDGDSLQVRDFSTGRLLRSLSGHEDDVRSAGFYDSNRKIATVSKDGTVRYWRTEDAASLAMSISTADGGWLTITPEGFFDASSPSAAQNLSVVRGLEVSSVDQIYNALYRPDLVREKLAGDPDGKVKAAAAKLDLNKVMASGSAPKVSITSPTAGTSSPTDEVMVEATVSDQGGGIGRVEWRVNGVTSGIETRGLERVEAAASSGRSLTVKRTLALERGQNRIELLAYNNKDLVASEPASVTVKWDGEKTATPPKLFVMAVGVNDYYDSRLRLSYAVPDATAIAEGFRKAGAGLYSAVDVTTVLDKDVTIANLDKVFTELGKNAQPRDVFVFFLAGHGKTKNGKYYFLPRDFRYEDEDSIEKAGMDQDKFQAWFAKIPARKSILLYDTCESGSLTGTKARGSDIDERLGALNRMTRATGRTFLTATTDDAPALEGYRGHGVFTYALLDALEHADINKNGLIEVSELADYIDQKVPDISFEAFKLRQIPQRNIVGNNFALMNKIEVLTVATGAAAAVERGTPSGPAIGTSPAGEAIPTKPTHVVITTAAVKAVMGDASATVTQLAPGTQVRTLETLGGWILIAREGQKLGYVESRALVALQ